MIALQKLNGQEFVLNMDLIESVEATPDTRIKLTSGKTMIVRNSLPDLVKKCIRYRQLCNSTLTVTKEKE